MKPMHIAMALLSAAMFFVLAGVFMGVQLELDGTKLVVDTASEIRWQWVFIGTAVVFFFQLVRPAFQKGLKSVSGPKFILPAIDGSTVKQKLFLVALLVLAVAWPFMVSRGTVDIVCWCWGMAAFTPSALTLLRCSITITVWASGPVCRLPG